jgi:hypothetical protein
MFTRKKNYPTNFSEQIHQAAAGKLVALQPQSVPQSDISHLSRAVRQDALIFFYQHINADNAEALRDLLNLLQSDLSGHTSIGEVAIENLCAEHKLSSLVLDEWFAIQSSLKPNNFNPVTASYLLHELYQSPSSFNLDAHKMGYFLNSVNVTHQADALTASTLDNALDLLIKTGVITPDTTKDFCDALKKACESALEEAYSEDEITRLQALIGKLTDTINKH